MDTTWDEAEELATDRAEWHQRVAKCFHLDVGLTKVYGKDTRSQASAENHAATWWIQQ